MKIFTYAIIKENNTNFVCLDESFKKPNKEAYMNRLTRNTSLLALRILSKRTGSSNILSLILFMLLALTSTCNAILDYDRAIVQSQKNNWHATQELLTQIVVEQPNRADALYDLGVASYKNNSFDAALSYFNKVAQGIDASTQLQVQAHFNAGNAHVQLKQLQEAIDAYDRVLSQNPTHPQALHNKEAVKKMLEQQKQDDKNNQNNKDQNEKEDSSDEPKQDRQDKQDQEKQNENNKQSSDDKSMTHKDQQQNKDDKNRDQNQQDKQSDGDNSKPDTQDRDNKSQDQKNKNDQSADDKPTPDKDKNKDQKSDQSNADKSDEKDTQSKQQKKQSGSQQDNKKQKPESCDSAAAQTEQKLGQSADQKPEQKLSAGLERVLEDREKKDAQLNKKMTKALVANQGGGKNDYNCW